VQFRYAPNGTRYVQSTSGGTNNEYYVDKVYEQIETGTSIEGRTHVSDVVEVVQNATRRVRYRHLDRLGSLEAASDETGVEDLAYGHGFDAFGDPRSRDWQSSGDQMGQLDERGFTGHEHLDNLRLIHMNGRVYDYKLGRFLSVDPVISSPSNSQSINPYSYVGNNPLSGTDPTGYTADTAATDGTCNGAKTCPEKMFQHELTLSSSSAMPSNGIGGTPQFQGMLNNGADKQTSQPSGSAPASSTNSPSQISGRSDADAQGDKSDASEKPTREQRAAAKAATMKDAIMRTSPLEINRATKRAIDEWNLSRGW
jgi:RHS repeat-associated protein